MTFSSISKLQWGAILSAPLVSLLFCLDELWRKHPAHHFFPLALGALVWLVVRKVRQLGCQSPLSSARVADMGPAPWLIAVHLLTALAAFVLDSPFLAGLALMAAAVSFDVACWSAGGRWGHDFYVSFLTVFLIPPPMALDEAFRQILAAGATRLSQVWLDDLGLLNLVEGSIVVTAGKRFFVDDACSGMNSLLVALCMAGIMAAFHRRSWAHLTLLMVTTACVAVGSNMLRIFAVIYGTVIFGLGLDKGLPHEVTGVVCFLVDLALVWAADRGLHSLLQQSMKADTLAAGTASAAQVRNGRACMGAGLSWLGSASMTVGCAGLLLILVPQFFLQSSTVDSDSMAQAQEREFALPARLGAWERQGDKPQENALVGDMSVRNVVWLYRLGGMEAHVAVNFPFAGMHDTRLCYMGQGWQLEKQQDVPAVGEQAPTIRSLDLFQPVEHQRACLWLMIFDGGGRALPYPVAHGDRPITDRLLQRWEKKPEPPVTFTLQVLVPAENLDAASGEKVDTLLQAARAHVMRELATSARGVSAAATAEATRSTISPAS